MEKLLHSQSFENYTSVHYVKIQYQTFRNIFTKWSLLLFRRNNLLTDKKEITLEVHPQLFWFQIKISPKQQQIEKNVKVYKIMQYHQFQLILSDSDTDSQNGRNLWLSKKNSHLKILPISNSEREMYKLTGRYWRIIRDKSSLQCNSFFILLMLRWAIKKFFILSQSFAFLAIFFYRCWWWILFGHKFSNFSFKENSSSASKSWVLPNGCYNHKIIFQNIFCSILINLQILPEETFVALKILSTDVKKMRCGF